MIGRNFTKVERTGRRPDQRSQHLKFQGSTATKIQSKPREVVVMLGLNEIHRSSVSFAEATVQKSMPKE